MDDELDLTHLTIQERNHLRSVLERAKKVEEIYKAPKSGAEKEVTSDDVIRKKLLENQASYVPACDALSAALNGGVSTLAPNHDSAKEDSTSVSHHSHQLDDSSDEDTTSSSSMSTPIRLHWKDSSDSTSSSDSMVRRRSRSFSRAGLIPVYPSLSREEISDKNRLTPHSAIMRSYTETLPRRGSYDSRSNLSRTNAPSKDNVGTIDISLTYLPPTAVRQKTFPSKGTRFPENKHLDVLTRKTYVVRSGAKIRINKESKSGANPDDDGEFHLFVRGANDLFLPRGMSQKGKTYVKCYLLPDRYHGSKMRSETYKDTQNPRYDHKFVFRGFSEKEFNVRAIEVVIGGVMSSRGRHLVVGGIRLSNGVQDQEKTIPWKNALLDETNLWKKAFQSPSTDVSGAITLRPKLKLTYK